MAGRGSSIERDLQVVELRLAGLKFDEIARRLQFANKGAACKAYHRALERAHLPEGEEALDSRDSRKKLELARLDRLQQGLWAKAARGDLGAVDRVLKIMQERARLEQHYPPRNASPAEASPARPAGAVVPESAVNAIRERRAREAAERAADGGTG